MIIADTSAWVEFDHATGGPVEVRMTELITANDKRLAVTEPVVMEVLAGARDEARANDLRRLMARFTLAAIEPVADLESAARIYRSCRREAITPRGMVDCLIAAVAVRRGATLLAQDSDLPRVATVMGIATEV